MLITDNCKDIIMGSSAITQVMRGSTVVWTKGEVEPDWLTLTIYNSGTIKFNHGGTWSAQDSYAEIEYSKNGGPWTKLSSSAATNYIYLNSGDIVKLRGTSIKGYYGYNYLNYYCDFLDGDYYYNNFSGSTASFKLSGNILSMEYGSGFTNQKHSIVNHDGYNSAYGYLFSHTKVVDAEGLILGEPTFNESGYTINNTDVQYIFEDCSSLLKAPILYDAYWPGDYTGMFSGCRSLNYIKCLFEGHGINNGIDYFSWGVADSGIFVKSANATWPTGYKGIPANWIVQNE